MTSGAQGKRRLTILGSTGSIGTNTLSTSSASLADAMHSILPP